MHVTAPGHQHIELLVAHPAGAASAPAPAARTALMRPRGTEPLVHQAIMASFSGASARSRDYATVLSASFGPAVRAHIRARSRTHSIERARETTASAPAGEVNIVTCHAREGGEFFGTVDAGGKRHAYAARVCGGKLTSFKVL